MKKWAKRILLIAVTPFVLYYGALAYVIVSWGIAEHRAEQTCIEYHVLNGVLESEAQELCL